MPHRPDERWIFLASRSPQRRALLERAGYRVEPIGVQVVESAPAGGAAPEQHVHQNALLKVEAARAKVGSGLILAADTVAHVAGEILGKPRDRADARRMLELLSGSRHEVLTGICLCRIPERIYVSAVETTVLVLRCWGRAQIDAYLDSGRWHDKAGAYAIQETDDPFVERLEGSVSNVIGLPLERLERLFKVLPALLGEP